MTSWTVLRRVKPYEWIILAVCVAAICYVASCAGVRSAVDPLERHGTQLGIGTAAGAGAGLLAGATGWGLIVAALVGSAVTIFSTPDCSELAKGGGSSQAGTPWWILHPVLSVIILGSLYVLWIRRARVIDGLRSGSFKALAAHWGHAFLGTKRPKAE